MVARKQRETGEVTWDNGPKNVPLSHLFSLTRAPLPAVFTIPIMWEIIMIPSVDPSIS